MAYTDTFSGSGALGTVESGGLAWQAITGTWSRSGGYAYTSTSGSSNPIAILDVGVGQIDMSASVSSSGGDALYFRVVDASNWLRARVRRWTTTSTYYVTEYEYSRPTYRTEYKYIITWFSINGAYHYTEEYTGWTVDPNEPYRERYQHSHTGYPNHTMDPYIETYDTRQVQTGTEYTWSTSSSLSGWTRTGNTRQAGPYSSSSTNYAVYLDRSIGGSVTTLGTYNSSATSLRVRADGTSIVVYVNGTSRISVTESTHQNATKHGIGRAYSESNGSAIDNFSLDPLIPPTPTINSPVNNATVGTGIPSFTTTVTPWGAAKTKIEYQIAQNNTFTTDLRTINEPDSLYRTSGSGTTKLTEAQWLTQRLWYVRARQVSTNGLAGLWTSPVAFTVAHSPGAINLRPSGGAGVVAGATNRLRWDFTDTSPIDSQKNYQVIVERNDNASLVVDTGKVAFTESYYDLTVDPALVDVQLRWKVRVWDEEDKVSSYANYALFVPTTAPTVDIVEPLDGSNVGTSRPLVRWVFAASGGRTQASYRVTVKEQGAAEAHFDSSTLPGNSDNYTVTSPVIENAKSYEIAVYVTDSLGITVSTVSTVNAVYEEPDVVPFSVDDEFYESGGYVRLTWQAVSDPTFIKWRVYRRLVGAVNWTLLAEINEATVTEYHDWLVPSMASYDYYVVQVVERFNEQVESVVGQSERILLGGGGYWLVDPVDDAYSMQLHNVTDEDYTIVHEQAEYTIVGRGRHVDEGEESGIAGSLTCQLRNTGGTTARFKKHQLETLRKMKKPVYLRNPFGDVYYIALGELSVTRIAGVGTDEFVDVTVPYLQVF